MFFCHHNINYLDKFWFYLMKLWQINSPKLRLTHSVSHINHISVQFAPNITRKRVKHVKLIRPASRTNRLYSVIIVICMMIGVGRRPVVEFWTNRRVFLKEWIIQHPGTFTDSPAAFTVTASHENKCFIWDSAEWMWNFWAGFKAPAWSSIFNSAWKKLKFTQTH